MNVCFLYTQIVIGRSIIKILGIVDKKGKKAIKTTKKEGKIK